MELKHAWEALDIAMELLERHTNTLEIELLQEERKRRDSSSDQSRP